MSLDDDSTLNLDFVDELLDDLLREIYAFLAAYRILRYKRPCLTAGRSVAAI